MDNKQRVYGVVGGVAVVTVLAVGANLLLSQPGELSALQSCRTGAVCNVKVTVESTGLFACRIVVPSDISLPLDATLVKSIIWEVSPGGFRFKSTKAKGGVEILGSHAGDFTAVPLTNARQFKVDRNPPTTITYDYELHIVGSAGWPECEGPIGNRPRIKNE